MANIARRISSRKLSAILIASFLFPNIFLAKATADAGKSNVVAVPQMRTTHSELSALAGGKIADFPTAFPISHVSLRWQTQVGANVSVQWRKTDGRWSTWQTVVPDDDAATTDGLTHAAVVAVDKTQDVHVSSNIAIKTLGFFGIDALYGPTRNVSVAPTDPVSGLAFSGLRVPAPNIISRAQWGANESFRRSAPQFAPVNKFIIHHTATPNNDPNPSATVRGIYADLVLNKGYNDMAYNYLIDASGNIYEGRYSRDYYGAVPTADNVAGLGVISAATMNANVGSMSIALIGNFTAYNPPVPMMNSLERLIAWQANRHGLAISNSTVFGHRDFYPTACPGDSVYSRLSVVRLASSTILNGQPGTRGIVASGVGGYWKFQTGGNVTAVGPAEDNGSLVGKRLAKPIVGMAVKTGGKGYWLAAKDGGIFTFGNAAFYGSTGGTVLNKPIVGMDSTPTGKGYWLVASDGGVFAFGDAAFYGSTGGVRLNRPIVGMAATSSGKGYWLVASDGGVFAFGDAKFHGSTGARKLNKPIVAIASSYSGKGYWLVASDGGLFNFGDAPFYGSAGNGSLLSPIVGMSSTGNGKGYWLVSDNGDVSAFGNARKF
jgi:hypothetical protein